MSSTLSSNPVITCIIVKFSIWHINYFCLAYVSCCAFVLFFHLRPIPLRNLFSFIWDLFLCFETYSPSLSQSVSVSVCGESQLCLLPLIAMALWRRSPDAHCRAVSPCWTEPSSPGVSPLCCVLATFPFSLLIGGASLCLLWAMFDLRPGLAVIVTRSTRVCLWNETCHCELPGTGEACVNVGGEHSFPKVPLGLS